MVIAVLIVIGVLFIANMNRYQKDNYSVVYLTSGEVYIGKLSTFPQLTLTDGYILVMTKDAADPTKNNFQLNPLSKALWSPEKIVLTRSNVIFYGPLEKTSKIAQTLSEQGK